MSTLHPTNLAIIHITLLVGPRSTCQKSAGRKYGRPPVLVPYLSLFAAFSKKLAEGTNPAPPSPAIEDRCFSSGKCRNARTNTIYVAGMGRERGSLPIPIGGLHATPDRTSFWEEVASERKKHLASPQVAARGQGSSRVPSTRW